jgi:transposase
VIPAGVRIFAATAPTDMRRGFVGLAEAARERLGHDPDSGALFVFWNKRRDRLKLLWHDRTGWCLLYKALGRGFFRIPEAQPQMRALTLDGQELAAILEGVQLPTRKATAKEIARRARESVLRPGSTGSNQAGA